MQPNNLGIVAWRSSSRYKQAMFTFLCERVADLFQAYFEVLL